LCKTPYCHRFCPQGAVQKQINANLKSKYQTDKDNYNARIIEDILNNEEVRIVAIFKDFLQWDEVSEMLKRSYNTDESH